MWGKLSAAGVTQSGDRRCAAASRPSPAVACRHRRLAPPRPRSTCPVRDGGSGRPAGAGEARRPPRVRSVQAQLAGAARPPA